MKVRATVGRGRSLLELWHLRDCIYIITWWGFTRSKNDLRYMLNVMQLVHYIFQFMF